MFIFEYRQRLRPGSELHISEFKEVSIPVYRKLPGFISVGVYKYEPIEQWGQTETEWDYVFVEVWESKEAQEKAWEYLSSEENPIRQKGIYKKVLESIEKSSSAFVVPVVTS